VAIAEAIRTGQFVRNKCLRLWEDRKAKTRFDLIKHCAVLAKEFEFANKLNSTARQTHADHAWTSIQRFYANCKKGIRPVGYPKYKKNARSVEYKLSGWKILDPKHIRFTDRNGIGTLKLVGTWDLAFYQKEQIKRVRIVRRADGCYVQFAIVVERTDPQSPSGTNIGLDMGLDSFYTDQNGHKEANPRLLRKGEQKLRRLQRRLSRKQKGSKNRIRARKRLARQHLKIGTSQLARPVSDPPILLSLRWSGARGFEVPISRQRKDLAIKLARCVVLSNDLVAFENLLIRNMVKNHCLARSISDAGWYQFRIWIEYYAKLFGRIAVAVKPQYTSQKCSACSNTVKKSLSTRTHVCKCGCQLDRDENAARNILAIALKEVGWGTPKLLDMESLQSRMRSTQRGCIEGDGISKNASGDINLYSVGPRASLSKSDR